MNGQNSPCFSLGLTKFLYEIKKVVMFNWINLLSSIETIYHYQKEEKNIIRNLELKCQCYYSCYCCEILAKSLQTPQNLCRPFKTCTCVSLRYIKHHGSGDSSSFNFYPCFS